MNEIDALVYFFMMLKASFFSTSGTGNVPSLLNDLIPLGWATERQFAESLAVGQISPGPSGLWVISLGYLTYGLPGALMATAAITIPPLTIIGFDKIYQNIKDHPAVQGFVTGLGLAVIGTFAVVLWRIWQSNGVNISSLLIILLAFGLSLTKKIPVIVILIIGGIIGVLLG